MRDWHTEYNLCTEYVLCPELGIEEKMEAEEFRRWEGSDAAEPWRNWIFSCCYGGNVKRRGKYGHALKHSILCRPAAASVQLDVTSKNSYSIRHRA